MNIFGSTSARNEYAKSIRQPEGNVLQARRRTPSAATTTTGRVRSPHHPLSHVSRVAVIMCSAVSVSAQADNPETHEVLVGNNFFDPPQMTARPGDTVRWIWLEGFHTATSGEECIPDGLFDLELNQFNQVAEFIIPADHEGDIPYFCVPHCTHGHLGLIVIEPHCDPADLNCDGVVDGADLGILLSNWGECEDCEDCLGDINGDCYVDGADLGILLANWG